MLAAILVAMEAPKSVLLRRDCNSRAFLMQNRPPVPRRFVAGAVVFVLAMLRRPVGGDWLGHFGSSQW